MRHLSRRQFLQGAVWSVSAPALGRGGQAAGKESDRSLIERQQARVDRALQAGITRRLARDPHRPRYHYQPSRGEWQNDVQPFYWKGFYHAFFQYAPSRFDWVWRHWGHIRSRDLVHWEELPIAITAGPESYDENLALSGCIVRDEQGKVHIFYGGPGQPRGMCHAVAEDDGLVSWVKDPANPLTDFTGDPDIRKDGNVWYMLVNGSENQRGVIRQYTSPDLKAWKYLNIFHTNPEQTYLEYPHFFRLDGKEVLTTALGALGTTWMDVGRVVNGVFQSERTTLYDCKLSCAAKTMLDDRGRRISMGWILDARYGAPMHTDPRLLAVGWAGLTSVPRVLHIAKDGSVRQEPVEELKTLRGNQQSAPGVNVGARGQGEDIRPLENIRGDCLEIIARFHPEGATRYGLLVRCAPDGSEKARIEVDREQKKLRIDNRQGSLDPGVDHQLLELDYPGAADSAVELRVFVDRSVIEVFTNHGRVITGRAYPTRPDAMGVALWSAGGAVRSDAVEAWEMKAIR